MCFSSGRAEEEQLRKGNKARNKDLKLELTAFRQIFIKLVVCKFTF